MDRSLVHQCGECSTLFLQPATMLLNGLVYELCPNPNCYGPIQFCVPIPESAVSWQFMHLIGHSGISEMRRMNLRLIAETQMGPWEFEYRSR